MQLVAKSDLSTGNTAFASYVLQSHDLVRQRAHSVFPEHPHGWSGVRSCSAERDVTCCMQVFAFTAPYSTKVDAAKEGKVPVRWYSREAALSFQESHGLGVRAVGAHCMLSACKGQPLRTGNWLQESSC